MSTFRLVSDQVRQNAIVDIMRAIPDSVVTISDPKRTKDQNAFFHALCRDIEKAGIQWAGRKHKHDNWKALLVSGHAEATKEQWGQRGDVIPGLEGEFVAIRESTARMGVKRANSLIEYTIAFCVANGVELRETRRGGFLE